MDNPGPKIFRKSFTFFFDILVTLHITELALVIPGSWTLSAALEFIAV
jgi:TctA family transporter